MYCIEMGYLSIKEIVLVPKDDFKGKKGRFKGGVCNLLKTLFFIHA